LVWGCIRGYKCGEGGWESAVRFREGKEGGEVVSIDSFYEETVPTFAVDKALRRRPKEDGGMTAAHFKTWRVWNLNLF
jgi:hypothetical protein